MRTRFFRFLSVLAFFSAGIFFVDCGGNSNSCSSDCGERRCGLTPATCDDPAATCGTCSGNIPQCNATTGMCEAACDTQCGSRQCGPTPATCDDPAATCGTCSETQTCNTATGKCRTTHDGAGDPCKCESANSCSVPCPIAQGAANTCITTDEAGNGFCSFACESYCGNADCIVDFPNGCCRNLSGDNDFCIKPEYCGPGPNGPYVRPCGTEMFCDCLTGLLCYRFNEDEEWGWCIYSCNCPNPDQKCSGADCADSGLCVPLADTATTGKGGCLPPGDSGVEEFCHVPDNSCHEPLLCVNFGVHNGMCSPACNHETGEGCTAPMTCEILLPDQVTWACARPCPSQSNTECPNGGAGWICKDIGTQGSPDYVCVPK
jgi:hypothetical protein